MIVVVVVVVVVMVVYFIHSSTVGNSRGSSVTVVIAASSIGYCSAYHAVSAKDTTLPTGHCPTGQSKEIIKDRHNKVVQILPPKRNLQKNRWALNISSS